jgi:hypothetical protein
VRRVDNLQVSRWTSGPSEGLPRGASIYKIVTLHPNWYASLNRTAPALIPPRSQTGKERLISLSVGRSRRVMPPIATSAAGWPQHQWSSSASMAGRSHPLQPFPPGCSISATAIVATNGAGARAIIQWPASRNSTINGVPTGQQAVAQHAAAMEALASSDEMKGPFGLAPKPTLRPQPPVLPTPAQIKGAGGDLLKATDRSTAAAVKAVHNRIRTAVRYRPNSQKPAPSHL